MPLEIERKFLVADMSWKTNAQPPVRMCQKYVSLADGVPGVIRFRIAGEKAWITLKTPQKNFVRGEFEYEIPVEDAEALMKNFCPGGSVEKLRYSVVYQGKEWVIDEFLGCYSGLYLAEIELNSASEEFSLPPWIGEEVSGNFRYSNSYLAENAK